MISRLFKTVNGKFAGPSNFVAKGMMGKPQAVLQGNVLSYAECWALINYLDYHAGFNIFVIFIPII